MPLQTYSDLQSTILNWLARSRDDEDAVVDTLMDFITLAEARITRELRVREMIERVSAPVNETHESMPGRFLEPVSAGLILSSGTVRPLKYVTAHELNRGLRNVEGDPVQYTIVGGQILFGPKIVYDENADPDDIPKIELIAYFSQPPLSDANPTNDILKYYPNIYLYASLIEASTFITSDQTGEWAGMYEAAVTQANETSQFTMDSVTREPPPAYLVV